MNQKAEPSLDVTETSTSSLMQIALQQASKADFFWILARLNCSADQRFPSWAGWISLTGQNMLSVNDMSTIDYMQPVLHPVTNNETVQHIIQISVDASREVGQETTLFTCDLAVAKKAYLIVWQNNHLKNVVIRLGVFHFLCSYMAALGKLMRGSG